MGLDTTHDAWHGAYSAFNRWRNEVAKAAGYDVAEVKFEGQSFTHTMPVIDYRPYTHENYMGVWGDHHESDPLMYLIIHSDCDGEIDPVRCAALAVRLTELLPLMPEDTAGGFWSPYSLTKQFIKGLLEAVSRNEPLKFH